MNYSQYSVIIKWKTTTPLAEHTYESKFTHWSPLLNDALTHAVKLSGASPNQITSMAITKFDGLVSIHE